VDESLRGFLEVVPGGWTPAVAVVAVGGYGRRELFLGSDVDLLIVHEEGGHRLAGRAAEAILYPLWDLGMVTGNAVRTVAECEATAAADPRALTALLSARLVAGSEDLLADLNVVVDRACRQEQAHFVGLLDALRERRRERFGFLSHATEPDLKEPLGGLRDVPVLLWLARAGLPAPSGARIALPAETLRRVRVALHLHTGSRSNRLEAADHEGVARALGLSDDTDWEARDALVRDVLRAGRAVDVLVEEALTEAAAAAAAARPPKATRPADLARALGSAAPEWRLAALVQALSTGEDGARAVEIADAHGAMDGFLDEWHLLRGRVQRDPYHRFPVDVHLLRTAAEVVSTLSRPADAVVADEVRAIGDPGALLLAALLHDAGKVGSGSHVEVGEDVARRALTELAASPEVHDDVMFRVREHLLLADTATRRDIGEEDVVLRVAGAIGDRRRLAMLHVLTIADAAATGSAAASTWRMGLVGDLVGRVERALTRGLIREEDVDQLARAERAIRLALEGTPVAARADAFLRGVPSAYLRWVDPADTAALRPPRAPSPFGSITMRRTSTR